MFSEIQGLAAEFTDWMQPVTLRTITRAKAADFSHTDSAVDVSARAIVTPAGPAQIKADGLDWSLRHIIVRTVDQVTADQIVYLGVVYRIVEPSAWSAHGWWRCAAEELRA